MEGDQRAAWSNLVAAYGSGRAAWIADNYQPVNLAAKPVKAAPSDEILVIPTQTPLAAAEATAISAYWQAVWLADGDAGKIQTASHRSCRRRGSGKSHAINSGLCALQPDRRAHAAGEETSVALSTAFVVFPADPPTKQDSWSQAPVVNHLADRFVVIGYNGGVQTLQAIGVW